MKLLRVPLAIPAAASLLILSAALPAGAQSPTDRETPPRSMFQFPPPARAEATAPPAASPEPAWGTTSETSFYVGPPAFHGAVPNVFVVDDGVGSAYFSGTGSSYAWAPVNIPQGAAITGFDFYWYDANPTQNMYAIIYEVDSTGSYLQVGSSITSSGSAGWGSSSFNLVTPWTVNNNTNSYWAWVATGATPVIDLRWRGVRVRYKLQVSPAPGVASFSDVPTSYWAFQYIEALKASGITGGVTPTTYEPESPVTRAQMAVFLAKALGLYWP